MAKFKTLKDFSEEGIIAGMIYGIPREYCVRMILINDLRAEAIKWVKEDIEKFGLFKGGIPEVTKEWMNRFNLTEEDLK